MDDQRQAFDDLIYQSWADYWHCSPELFGVPGVSFRARLDSDSASVIHFTTIRQHTFIEHSPADGEQLQQIVDGLPLGKVVDASAVAAGWLPTNEHTRPIETLTRGLILHLFPDDLPERHLPGGFALRRLTSGDDSHIRLLEEAVSLEDVSDAYVSVAHEIACGVFQLRGQGETPFLVTAASAYERAGFVDPGVLTHPQFRGRGFGSAAVHALCQWAFRQNRMMQYRCNRENAASLHLAQRLGFRGYVIQDNIWLR
ncbi:MAG: GNAT family N-acetyltransferase [Caldilineaceae bacterium]|nr:GNAT family N-acetyltransferase [Caldilineaceae bacterium]